ncbi:uncharacterized protein LOC133184519 [Saccostrea echinata]|uniref:uncharacterized protein LOC133184519 n=1 Tax=Saccostrea echinata TaxID=191078 RepID=UPI002A81C789|nr:uncharacterized protein LOC133184519 [Saccostrea echinata]
MKQLSNACNISKKQIIIWHNAIFSSTERSIPTTVAFHDCFSHNVENLGRVHELAYDQVLEDTHAAYERLSGTYRVPSEGYYVFTWATCTYHGNVPLGLLVNGVVKGRSHSRSNANDDSATGLVIISVAVNDAVIIRTHPDYDPHGIILSDKWQTSCFSGWKLN